MAATTPPTPQISVAKITSKSQITIPIETRKLLGVKPMDQDIYHRAFPELRLYAL